VDAGAFIAFVSTACPAGGQGSAGGF
jgi:hypothetical protein